MPDDFGQTNATAGTGTIGTAITGEIETIGDKDWLAYDLTEGVVYEVKLTGIEDALGARINPRVDIYDETGRQRSSQTDGNADGLVSFTYFASSGGLHYFEVEDLHDANAGAWELEVIEAKADLAPTAVFTSGTWRQGAAVEIAHELYNGGNIAAGPSLLGIYASSDPDLSASDTLIATIATAAMSPGEIRSALASYIVDLPVGVWYVGLGADAGLDVEEANELNNFTPSNRVVQVNVLPDDQRNDITTSGVVAPHGDVTGELEYVGDHDFFAVQLTAGVQYRFDVEGEAVNGSRPEPNLFMTLRDGTGAYISANDNGGPGVNAPRITYTPTVGGTYYLDVSDSGEDDVGGYRLTSTAFLPNLAITSVEGDEAILYGGRTYFMRITFANDGLAPTGDGAFLSNITATDASGAVTQLAAIGYAPLNAGQSNSLSTNYFVDLAPGDYDITFTVDSDGDVAEQLEDDNTFTFSTTVIHDPQGDTVATAGAIAMGETVAESIDYAGDRDWYAVTLEDGVEYQVDLVGGKPLSDPFLILRDASGAMLMANDDGGAGLDSRLVFTASGSGTYHLDAGPLGSTEEGGYELTIQKNLPNLVISDLTVDTLYWEIGTQVGIDFTTSNTGLLDAGPQLTRLFASTDATVDQGDLQLGGAYDPSGIAAGASSTRSNAYTVSLAEGTWFIGAVADVLGAVTEQDEADNSSSNTLPPIEVFVYADDFGESLGDHGEMPDDGLIAGTLEAPGDRDWFRIWMLSGVDHTISLAGTGTETGLFDPFLRVYNASGVQVAGNDDAVGLDSEVVFNPANAGWFFIEAAAFNDAYRGDYTVQVVPDLPDLRPVNLALTGPSSVLEGTDVTVEIDIENIGVQPTGGGFAVDYYATPTTGAAASEIFLGRFDLGPLGVGATVDDMPSLNTGILAPGGYLLRAIVDGGGDVIEQNEHNNTTNEVALTILPDMNLEITAFTLEPTASVFQGAPENLFEGSITLVNAGPTELPATTLAYYLSFDDALDAGDIRLGSSSEAPIAGFGSRTIALGGPLGSGLPSLEAETPFWIFAVADDLDVATETDEDDNVASTQIVLPGLPNLTIEAFETSAAHLRPGETITVRVVVTNTGPSAAAADDVAIVLSPDADVSPTDEGLGLLGFGPLAAGASVEILAAVTLPASLDAGSLHLGAIVNFDGDQDETSFADNTTGDTGDNIFIDVVEAPVATGGRTIAEVGHLLLNETPRTIVLDHSFENPVVIAKIASSNDPDVATVRLSDVSGDRFTLMLQEPNADDGVHGYEQVHYMVIEAGDWELADGTRLSAGTLQSGKLSPSGFEQVGFTAGQFGEAPAIQTQVQTFNGGDYVVARQRGADAAGFQVTMQEEELLNDSGHARETLGWFAIDPGAGRWDGLQFAAGSTADVVTHSPFGQIFPTGFGAAPEILTSIGSFDGADPATARVVELDGDGLVSRVQEDTTKDAETDHGTETIDWFAIGGSGTLTGDVPLPTVAEYGTTRVNANWVQVDFDAAFENAVVIATVNSRDGPAPVTVRIDEVGADGFRMKLQEPAGEDGAHGFETVSWIAVEEGAWRLADGTILEAGEISSAGLALGGPAQVDFSAPLFSQTPTILSHVQTNVDPDWATTRQQGADADGFQLMIQEDEINLGTPHGAETLGWLAFEFGPGAAGGDVFDAGRLSGVRETPAAGLFNTGFDDAPTLLADLSSYTGRDPAEARATAVDAFGFTVFAQEDVSKDAETARAPDTVDYLALEGDGRLGGAAAIPTIAQVGRASLNVNEQRIDFDQAFIDPVVFALAPTQNGPAPVVVRISDVDATGFTARLQEPSNEDGRHGFEQVGWMVIEAGAWRLSDGTRVQVGTYDSDVLSSAGTESVTFGKAFDDAPVVFSQVQTDADPAWVTTRQTRATSSGFEMNMQEEEATNGGTHGVETLGWMAFEEGAGDWDGFAFEATSLPDTLTHAFQTFAFASDFASAPVMLAALAGMDGIDPSSLRSRGLSAEGVDLRVMEETSADAETGHTTDPASLFAIADEAVLTGTAWL
ncbi:CARDB domain-containing protein [Albimonas sp. CAU 1670]|uniref:CARDB domain-containing protein n=1 Tax=Albimonas sp. CAU 1670 TaxID=3032599 RepID=UPI0023DC12BE|nr:CARDB domain-containing protein [Albimonas sp. CAU 1670]MDF2234750.1 CARDB domain-containing protein [Albimonas sp. CAU 1670]